MSSSMIAAAEANQFRSMSEKKEKNYYGSIIHPDNNNNNNNNKSLYRRRSSLLVYRTFFDEFRVANGACLVVLMGFVTALGIAGILGVVPHVTTQNFAQAKFGLEVEVNCSEQNKETPLACRQAAEYAQGAASYAALVSHFLGLLANSWAGSYADRHGRRGIQILALFLMVGSPLAFVAIQLWDLSPLWYYGFESISRILSPFSIAFTQLSDVLPAKHRAAAFGLFQGAFMAGIALGPCLATMLSHLQVSILSLGFRLLALLLAIVLLPETLSEERLLEAPQHLMLKEEEEEKDQQQTDNPRPPFSSSSFLNVKTLWQPLRKLEILQRSSSLYLIALGAFTSKMVLSADVTLLFYYLESNLGVTERDVAVMMLLAGIMGVVVQAGLLKYLISLLGEHRLLVTSFGSGVVHNLVYGLARHKSTIYGGMALSALTNTNSPLLSSLASRHVLGGEQGQMQGALFGLASIAEALGPVVFHFVSMHFSVMGPGTMFVVGALLYACGMVAVSRVPPRPATAGVVLEDMNMTTNIHHDDDDEDETRSTGCITHEASDEELQGLMRSNKTIETEI